MIRTIRGTVVGRGKGYLILEVGTGLGSLGFKVAVPEPTAAQFRADDSVHLHTYLQVREDDLSLFGFETEDELTLFEQLLGVSGVGPKVALSALSTMPPDALRLAIGNKEPAIIARVPGIGKRTAEKIVLDLKDKVGAPTSQLESALTHLGRGRRRDRGPDRPGLQRGRSPTSGTIPAQRGRGH